MASVFEFRRPQRRSESGKKEKITRTLHSCQVTGCMGRISWLVSIADWPGGGVCDKHRQEWEAAENRVFEGVAC